MNGKILHGKDINCCGNNPLLFHCGSYTFSVIWSNVHVDFHHFACILQAMRSVGCLLQVQALAGTTPGSQQAASCY